jgi:tol-pal system protein YbgF
MKRPVPALTVFSLLLLLGGCTTSLGGNSPSLKKEVESLRREVDSLKDQNRLGDLRGGPETAALRADLDRLSSEVNGHQDTALRQQVETLIARLERLEQKAGLPAAPEQGAVQPAALPEQTGAAPSEPAAKGLYEEGKTLFDRKAYREAAELFQNYLREEPKGANAAAAQFYIGETLYLEKRYEEAILEYQKVVQGFPKSSQVPTSLLKQGLSFQALGDGGSAKLLYQKVVNNYPKSYASGVAKERLKGL